MVTTLANVTGDRSDPIAQLRHRTLVVLTIGQILGGLGLGAALSVGALAASDLAGAAWSGSPRR